MLMRAKEKALEMDNANKQFLNLSGSNVSNSSVIANRYFPPTSIYSLTSLVKSVKKNPQVLEPQLRYVNPQADFQRN